MALSTEARTEIAVALAAAGLPAFAYLPATVTVPAVVVLPADPYILPDRIGRGLAYTVAFRLEVMAPALDNLAGLVAVETMVDAVLSALPDGVTAVRISQPALDDMGAQGAVYVSEIQITAHVQEGT